jgi:effector-binding domain-containing protein
MTTAPEIRELEGRPALVSRAAIDPSDLPSTVDRGFPALFARAGERIAGPPFIRYLRTGEQFEIELGVPVTGEGDVTLPAGHAAVLVHEGPFEGLRASCDRLLAWVAGIGERPGGPLWESYLTDPRTEPDSSRWLTEITVPLA